MPDTADQSDPHLLPGRNLGRTLPYPTAITAPAAMAQNNLIYAFGGTSVNYSGVPDQRLFIVTTPCY